VGSGFSRNGGARAADLNPAAAAPEHRRARNGRQTPAGLFADRETGDDPIVDSNDFELDLLFTPDSSSAVASEFPTIYAVREQLGLKLEASRGPVEVLVIDNTERPTPDWRG
jgi:uncharacterized protein (TIGR03435 family)